MTLADRLRAWLDALHEFRTDRYLAKHRTCCPRPAKSGAVTTVVTIDTIRVDAAIKRAQRMKR